MEPVLNEGVFAFVSVADSVALGSIEPVATIREQEGVSAIIRESDANELGFPVLLRAAWITLKVQSDLQAVGFTAAFSSALGAAGISCNVVAGAWHDHIFVPVEQADQAIAVLQKLQRDAAS